MDIPRPDRARALRRRRMWLTLSAVAALALVTWLVSRLEPAAPMVDSPVWVDTVKRGEMLRQVRGPGTLVPERIQYVQSESDGRVERIFVQPGTEVTPDTILLELSNPELKQAAFDAEWALKASEAQLERLRANLESDRLTQLSQLATLKAEHAQAEIEAQADEALGRDGLVPPILCKKSRSRADDLKARVDIEEQRTAFLGNSAAAQMAVQQADVEKLRALLVLKHRQVANLEVRAGISGVLQQTGDREPLQVGQRVSPAATLAKVVEPTNLRADVRISETQARDIMRDQVALIDTRNGIIPGRVQRVDPAVQNSTVLVEVKLTGPLPKGARPDLSVEGTIELERLTNVVYVGKPVQGQEDSTAGLFRVIEGGKEAVRVPVKLGRSSVSSIEVREGLQPGDQVILSDMSQWDAHHRVRLK
ncbi:MAG: HlyD family efflux transporter periplasmic adaptor subunit [Verrucomicrobiales bacterium]|nr:HlyD family efflux transporter periplasmic adaptor subunit [Verrucomicrobiales bacterium]